MNTSITKESIYSLSIESFGIVPGVIKELAERSVPVAYLYLSGNQIMEKSALNDLEINAIELKISSLNKCESCIKGHSFLLKKAGLSDHDVQAIIRNDATKNERLNTLLKAAEHIYYSGSDHYPDHILEFFEEEGITEQTIFEIIGLISLKTISNFVNNYLASAKRRQRSII
ncbi:MAG TPA: carboxymuconolactone decarboxylase family protein [Chryseolinea sp.]